MTRLKVWIGTALLLVVTLVVFIFANTSQDEIDEEERLIVVSPHPTEFIIPLIQEFENETGISATIINSGTADAISEIITNDDIDVLWGGSVLAVGSYKDYFYPYNTLNKAVFKEKCKDVGDEITCFSDVPSILMVNNDLAGNIEINGYEDLLDERLSGRIAMADPSKSSSSFEQLVNMLYAMGNGNPDNGWDFVNKFVKQLDGNLLTGSSQVYEGVANGKYVVGLTFEEAAVTMLKNDKHISVVYMEEGVVSTPDGIYINKNTKRLNNAERFVDFMTSKDVQIVMASDLGRRSVRKDVEASKMVIADDEINSIEVDGNEVIACKKDWTERFLEMYEEESND